jgi:predicted MPP superfamily phosphohydrolase
MLWLLLAIALVTIWATCIERFWFAVKTDSLEILPRGSKDIVVLHISDIHMAPWQKRKQRWIATLAKKVSPHLVINTGDNLGHKQGIRPVLDSMQTLKGIPGVFVSGSNDLFAPVKRNPIAYLLHPSDRHREQDLTAKLDTETLNKGFIDLGWHNLNNSAATIRINDVVLGFVGTDDPHEGRADLLAAAESAKKISNRDLLIGVTHAPYLKVLTQLHEIGSEVIFAGHTHGGQVCWPFIGRALVTNCDLPTKYARGLHKVTIRGKEIILNVCAGLGNSIYAPVRLACRPEVRVITLKAKN